MRSPQPVVRPPSTLREYVEAALVAVLLALFVKAFVFEGFLIPTPSMEDNLLVGDHVLVNKFVYAAHRGPWAWLLPYAEVRRDDVVVFKAPEDPSRDLVKRAVAVAGDTVAIRGKALVRNGAVVREPRVCHRDPKILSAEGGVPEEVRRRDEMDPVTVPGSAFFAMGDNRDESHDSRFWGAVPETLVKGRAVAIYWSYEAPPAGRTASGRGAEVRRFLDTAVHFVSRTRWSRTFRLVR